MLSAPVFFTPSLSKWRNIASYLFERLLIQPYSGQEHLIDFVVDLCQRQVDFAFQVQGIQLDQAAGEDVDENQKAVFVADGLVVDVGDQAVDEQLFQLFQKDRIILGVYQHPAILLVAENKLLKALKQRQRMIQLLAEQRLVQIEVEFLDEFVFNFLRDGVHVRVMGVEGVAAQVGAVHHVHYCDLRRILFRGQLDIRLAQHIFGAQHASIGLGHDDPSRNFL